MVGAGHAPPRLDSLDRCGQPRGCRCRRDHESEARSRSCETGPVGTVEGRLEAELEADLEVAGPARSGDDAEVPVPHLRLREAELRRVREVERFETEAGHVLLARAELLLSREIPLRSAGSGEDPLADIAERAGLVRREGTRIPPAGRILLGGAHVLPGHHVRPQGS